LSLSVTLPADLVQAEAMTLASLKQALSDRQQRRWTVTWRFEGLRLLQPALRLAKALETAGHEVVLGWPDAGSTALAQRESPELAAYCFALKDLMLPSDPEIAARMLLVIGPQPSDYEMVEQICNNWQGAVVLLNGKLEDAGVGIGSVARGRRKGFLSIWRSAFHLEPLAEGALLQTEKEMWHLFKADPDGYRFLGTMPSKPDAEAIEMALNGDRDSLGRQLGAVDRFIEDLRG
jgi:hypothetical protein